VNTYPAVVIGAGPAGLATSQQLKTRNVEHVVLERADIGESWSRVYDSLTLHTGKHMSALPGMKLPRSAPLFINRDQFLQYLRDYCARFALPVESGREVIRLTHDGAWRVVTNERTIAAQAVVVATGIMSKPRIPQIEGSFRGVVRHSITYRKPEECRGKRVLVVGAGNSAGEIASELGRAGVDTTISVRSGANVVPLQLLGVPIQYWSYLMQKLPRSAQEVIVKAMQKIVGPPVIPRSAHSPLDAIPLIGFRLVDAIKDGSVKLRGGIESFTPSGARFSDGREEEFDEVILATGFTAAIDFLKPLITTDAKGFGKRRNRVISTDQPNLFFVGHNYDATGGLFNIRRDAPLAADGVTSALRRT
jgi:cation diffusion facilitator CzcD-associated flavoprotein CzcO